METKVVVTGLGMIAPTGNTVESAWKNICEGRSGVGRITRFDASELQTQIAGEVKGFAPEEYGTEISDEEAEKIITVGDAFEYIKSRQMAS